MLGVANRLGRGQTVFISVFDLTYMVWFTSRPTRLRVAESYGSEDLKNVDNHVFQVWIFWGKVVFW